MKNYNGWQIREETKPRMIQCLPPTQTSGAAGAAIAVAAPGHTPCSERAPPKSRERASDPVRLVI